MDIIERFEIDAEHQLLRYAASKQIFCPVKDCGKVLDYRKTVYIEMMFKDDVRPVIMCSKCYESEPVQTQLKRFKTFIKEITKYRTK